MNMKFVIVLAFAFMGVVSLEARGGHVGGHFGGVGSFGHAGDWGGHGWADYGLRRAASAYPGYATGYAPDYIAADTSDPYYDTADEIIS